MNYRYLALLLSIGSCSSQDKNSSAEVDTRPSVPWTESMIRGATFSSIPDSGIVSLGFTTDGNAVGATIGDRRKELTAPLLHWSIDASGALILSEHTGEVVATLELIEFAKGEVTVRKGGEIIRYKRTE